MAAMAKLESVIQHDQQQFKEGTCIKPPQEICLTKDANDAAFFIYHRQTLKAGSNKGFGRIVQMHTAQQRLNTRAHELPSHDIAEHPLQRVTMGQMVNRSNVPGADV